MINVMTYDLYGSWTNKIGHHSALFHRPEEKSIERELNTVCSNQNKIYFRIELKMFYKILN
jgi:GH18 family chitinase